MKNGYLHRTRFLALFAAVVIFALIVFSGAPAPKPALALNIDAEAMRVLRAAEAHLSSCDYSATMTGTIKARVFGIPYTQKAYGSRTVSGQDFTDIAESKSTFVKAGIKKSCSGGRYYVSRGDYKRKRFVYGTPAEYGYDSYVAAYGKLNVGLIKYETDGGAVTSATVNFDGSYTYKLDPKRATRYSKNEVKSTIESKAYPEYEYVEFTLYTSGDVPIKTVTKEKFRIDKFGGTTCTTEYTESFEY